MCAASFSHSAASDVTPGSARFTNTLAIGPSAFVSARSTRSICSAEQPALLDGDSAPTIVSRSFRPAAANHRHFRPEIVAVPRPSQCCATPSRTIPRPSSPPRGVTHHAPGDRADMARQSPLDRVEHRVVNRRVRLLCRDRRRGHDHRAVGRRRRHILPLVLHRPHQCIRHLLGCRMPLLPVLRHRPPQHVGQCFRHAAEIWAGTSGCAVNTCQVTSVTLRPPNARVPVSNSNSTVPTENKSLRASTVSPRHCSGDI